MALSALFEERDDLVLVHNMGRGCPYCSQWADGFQGLLPHLQDRTAFVVCSPDAPDVQAEFAASRGWTFPMVSDADGAFTQVMGFRQVRGDKVLLLPGYSVFHRGERGAILRVGADHFGPGDAYNGLWHMFARLRGGVGTWQPRLRYD